MSASVRGAMNSLGYNEQQARNSKAAYDVMGTCYWIEREQEDVLKDFVLAYQHGSKLKLQLKYLEC